MITNVCMIKEQVNEKNNCINGISTLQLKLGHLHRSTETNRSLIAKLSVPKRREWKVADKGLRKRTAKGPTRKGLVTS